MQPFKDKNAHETGNASGGNAGISELSAGDVPSPQMSTRSQADGLQVQGALPLRQGFKIKGIAADSVYLDGGTNSGLQKGMQLIVRDSLPSSTNTDPTQGAFVAELRIIAVATTSAVAEVREAKRELKRGDWAVLTPRDAETARTARTTECPFLDPIGVPLCLYASRTGPNLGRRFRIPIEPRMQGRIGLDYSGITSDGSTPGSSTQLGLSFQSDMTHILGTHWNLAGLLARTNQSPFAIPGAHHRRHAQQDLHNAAVLRQS